MVGTVAPKPVASILREWNRTDHSTEYSPARRWDACGSEAAPHRDIPGASCTTALLHSPPQRARPTTSNSESLPDDSDNFHRRRLPSRTSWIHQGPKSGAYPQDSRQAPFHGNLVSLY